MHTLSLAALRDVPPVPVSEALTRASRFVSGRVGIISSVVFAELTPDEPAVHVVHSIPANTSCLAGRDALNHGAAASTDRARAMMKAVGESVERYCCAFYDDNSLVLGAFEDQADHAVNPEQFALFSPRQYAEGGFQFAPATVSTPLRWVQGYSLTADRPVLVPAAMVYIPYQRAAGREPRIADQVSTGLACAPTRAIGLYRGAMECVERDAFSVMWHNRLTCSHIDLAAAADANPMVGMLLNALESAWIDCRAVILTLDIPVPIVLIVLTSRTDTPPLTVIGLGTDLSPTHALILALEEACLGLYGMGRRAIENPEYHPRSPYREVETLGQHGLAHALLPELRRSMDFLYEPATTVRVTDLPDLSNESAVANARTIAGLLSDRGLEMVAVDLTTPDVDEVGFKVVRVIVPGLQPLDNNHRHRYLGGRRLYEVPVRVGAASTAPREENFNPYPHPFP